MDADGFLGEADLEHWYGVNRVLLDTGGFEAVSLEQVRRWGVCRSFVGSPFRFSTFSPFGCVM